MAYMQFIILFFFYENDTNEIKGSYHDDWLEKKNNKKHILHIELGHGG